MGTRPPVADDWQTVDDWEEVPDSQDPRLQAALAATRDTMNNPEALGSGFLGNTGPATAVGVASLLPFLAPTRLAGAAMGGYEGVKGGERLAGPVGGLAGGALGAIGGALRPGSTGAVTGAIEGGALEGNVGGAALGALMGLFTGGKGKEVVAAMKGVGRFAKGAKDAATIAREVKSAQTAARVGRALPPPKAVDVIPGFDTTKLMQLKTAWSSPEGRAQIREWVKTQEPEMAKQIKAFLLSNAMR